MMPQKYSVNAFLLLSKISPLKNYPTCHKLGKSILIDTLIYQLPLKDIYTALEVEDMVPLKNNHY